MGWLFADTEKIKERIVTCMSCENLNKSRCKICGCWVRLKARVDFQECPIKKWPGDKVEKKEETL